MPPRKSLPTAAPPAEKAASIAPGTAKESSPLDQAAQPHRAVSVPEGADTVAEKGNSHPHGSKRESTGINIEDLTLPKAITTRLAKEHLPNGTAVQATALLGIQKSATVFINYLASQANEYAMQANRKTVNPQDVLKAIEEVGFGEWKAGLEAQLKAFENNAKAKKSKNKSEKVDGEDGKEERPRKKLKGHKAEVQDDEAQDQDTILVDEEEEEDEKGDDDESDHEDPGLLSAEEGEEEQEVDEEDVDEDELRIRGKSEDEALDNGEDSD